MDMLGLFKGKPKGRRDNSLIEEEDANVGHSKRPTSLQLCMQLALICACIVILFFGLAVTAIGLWGYHSQQEYLTITDEGDHTELTRLPFSMMVTGGFVALLGLIGVTGSIFSRTITGQTLLGVFSFVLVLIIISEVGAGVAAIRLEFRLEMVYTTTAEKSFLQYPLNEQVREKWDDFQEQHKCCGAVGYVNDTPPYFPVFENVSVPESCCRDKDDPECPTHALNATEYREKIFDTGCPSAVVGDLTKMVTVIAIIALVLGTTQLLAVFLAVVVGYMSSRLDSDKGGGDYSYNKLLQQENSQPIPT